TAALQQQIRTFHPAHYADRKPGSVRTVVMEFADGLTATVTTTYERTGNTPMKDRADKLARIEEAHDALALRVDTIAAGPKPLVSDAGINLALPLADAGVYRADRTYQRGVAVTHGGSLWIAQRDTSSTPGTSSSGWRLAAKRGNPTSIA